MVNLVSYFGFICKKSEFTEEKPFYLLDSSMKVQKISSSQFQAMAIQTLKWTVCGFCAGKAAKNFRYKELESSLQLLTASSLVSFLISSAAFVYTSKLERKNSANDFDVSVFDSPIDCQI